MDNLSALGSIPTVALFVSAWIETGPDRNIQKHPDVALFVSAWIET